MTRQSYESMKAGRGRNECLNKIFDQIYFFLFFAVGVLPSHSPFCCAYYLNLSLYFVRSSHSLSTLSSERIPYRVKPF